MEQYDAQMARRVWQRVTGTRESVGSLIAGESQCVAVCRRLAKQTGDRNGQWKALEEQCQQHIRCLRGIGYLVSGKPEGELPLKPRQETVAGLLRTGYLQCVKLTREYRRWAEDEEYGVCFRCLADQKQRQSLAFLDILGSQ